MLDSQRKYELRVRPLGRNAADEYYHNGSIWIEGRNGNSYTVDISNHTNRRALFIVSVDGLDVLKGKPAGPESEGYVVDAYSTLSIPGWKLNDKEAAEFFFSRNDDSYVNSIGGSTANTGVIGAMVFGEMIYTSISNNFRDYLNVASTPAPAYWLYNTTTTSTPYDPIVTHGAGTSTTLGPIATGTGAVGGVGYGQYHATLQSTLTGSNTVARRVDTSSTTGITSAVNMISSPVTQDIGTGFGDATTWQTTTTTFTRANPTTPDCILAVYYNTARNLEKMGIQLKKRKDVSRTANAFPAYDPGCKPPPGWQK
jgi:hypothetical protein